MRSKIIRAVQIFRTHGASTLFRKFNSFVYVSLVEYFLSPIGSLIALFGAVIPNSPKLVLFSTRDGRLYEDNSRYLYEYILENEPELNPVWVTHEKKVYNDLLARSLPVRYVYSLGGIWALCRASVGVTTHGKGGFAFHRNAVPETLSIVLVGHGDPVKGNQRTPKELKKAIEKKRDINYIVTTSEFTREFRLKQHVTGDKIKSLPESFRNKFITTGYPRTDLLLEPPDEAMAKWDEFLDGLAPNDVVLYAPTKHYGLTVEKDDPAVDFFPFNDFNKKQLCDYLKENEMLLLFRPHPASVRNMYDAEFGPHNIMKMQLMELCEECEYIRMATQYEIADTTELLPFVDILVTDYSSIYHDFLLLDRPILFVPYDYQAFETARGFSYDYYDHLPGPELSSFAEFQSELSDIQDGVDRYQAKRRRLRNLIHKHQDGCARERLTKRILDLCGNNMSE